VIAAAYFPATLAAKAATSTTPIVFISGVDPIAAGLVASLNRPGGNLTGVSNFNTSLTAKRLELLHQVVPRGGSIVVLVNSTSPATETIEAEGGSAAEALGVRLEVLGASTEDEIAAQLPLSEAPAACLSPEMRISTAGARNSSHWRHAIEFLRITIARRLRSMVG